MSEAYPSDRGAIMGLYSVFLALGQIVGSFIGGTGRPSRAESTGSSPPRSSCSRSP